MMRLSSRLRSLTNDRVRVRSVSVLLFTLLIAALFKVAAFWRETFIASRFGVSADTDIYFGLQQLPMALLTFVLGAFGLAFTPAYSEARRTDERSVWSGGMLTLALFFGLAGSVLTVLSEPLLLKAIHTHGSSAAHLTVVLLSLSYAPILICGLWVCMNNAAGRTPLSLTVTGLPSLMMTVTLVLFCLKSGTQSWSLPGSWLAGFLLTAVAGSFALATTDHFSGPVRSMITLFGLPSFRRFLRQLGSSVLENAGFISNQLLMISFFGMAGAGAITANNYAMRIGMLGFGILTIPLSQLTQSRLCATNSVEGRRKLFVHQLAVMAALIGSAAAVIFMFREDVARLVYLRGRFVESELRFVVSLLPAWLSYFVVMSLNAVISRMLFAKQEGMRYTRTMLCAYGIANLMRGFTADHLSAASIIWASVLSEGAAFLWNLRYCLARPVQQPSQALVASVAPASA